MADNRRAKITADDALERILRRAAETATGAAKMWFENLLKGDAKDRGPRPAVEPKPVKRGSRN
jgi:hypothetical protein